MHSRTYYRKIHPFSPVFRNDFRRRVGLMWMNAMNFNDGVHAMELLRLLCHRDCSFGITFEGASQRMRSLFPSAQNVTTLKEFVLHCIINMLTVPDLAAYILSYQIMQSKGVKNSVVTIHVRFDGSLCYCLSPNTNLAYLLSSFIGNQQFHSVDSSIRNVVSRAKPSLIPIPPSPKAVFGYFVFVIDENMAITELKFHFTSIEDA